MMDGFDLIDHYCENNLLVGEGRRHVDSRCVARKNMVRRKKVDGSMERLVKDYPDLGDIHTSKFRSLPLTVLYKLLVIRDVDIRAKVMDVVVTALRTNTCPLTGKQYQDRTIKVEDWHEIYRMVRGLPPTGRVNRHIVLYPDEIDLLKSVIRKATVEARRVGSKDEVEALAKLQYKILGPKHV